MIRGTETSSRLVNILFRPPPPPQPFLVNVSVSVVLYALQSPLFYRGRRSVPPSCECGLLETV
jgi:hypothetical protein